MEKSSSKEVQEPKMPFFEDKGGSGVVDPSNLLQQIQQKRKEKKKNNQTLIFPDVKKSKTQHTTKSSRRKKKKKGRKHKAPKKKSKHGLDIWAGEARSKKSRTRITLPEVGESYNPPVNPFAKKKSKKKSRKKKKKKKKTITRGIAGGDDVLDGHYASMGKFDHVYEKKEEEDEEDEGFMGNEWKYLPGPVRRKLKRDCRVELEKEKTVEEIFQEADEQLTAANEKNRQLELARKMRPPKSQPRIIRQSGNLKTGKKRKREESIPFQGHSKKLSEIGGDSFNLKDALSADQFDLLPPVGGKKKRRKR